MFRLIINKRIYKSSKQVARVSVQLVGAGVRFRAHSVGIRAGVKTELNLVVGLRLILLLNWNQSDFLRRI